MFDFAYLLFICEAKHFICLLFFFHELFDHILYSVLNPVITKLRNQHYAVLRASGTDEDTRKIALREYQAKDKPVEKMLSKNYRYKNNTLIYKQI